jgi:hypothetical protein
VRTVHESNRTRVGFHAEARKIERRRGIRRRQQGRGYLRSRRGRRREEGGGNRGVRIAEQSVNTCKEAGGQNHQRNQETMY